MYKQSKVKKLIIYEQKPKDLQKKEQNELIFTENMTKEERINLIRFGP